MPTWWEMTHHAPMPGSTGNLGDGARRPGGREHARQLPAALRDAREALFEDADRHGPRRPVLARRILPATIALPIAVGSTLAGPWREWLAAHASADVADLLLVVPMLAAIVAFAAAVAPLARVRIEPLLAGAVVLLGVGAWLVQSGDVVWASVPSAAGATILGIAAARVVRRAVWTLPLLLAAGVSDAHSVAFGVTDHLLGDTAAAGERVQVAVATTSPPELVARIDLLVLHVPVGTGTWLLGLVDVVAIGMLLGLAHLFWLSLARTAIAMGVALAGAVALGGVVPVLPLLGLAWVVANAPLVWRSTRFSLRRLTYLGG